MTEALCSLLKAVLRDRPNAWVLVQEMQVSTAVPDILIIENVVSGDWPSLPPDLNRLEATVLATLRVANRTRIERLEALVGLPRRGLRNGALDRLIALGAIHPANGGVINLVNNWSESIRITAIESKLTKWKKAVWQAETYLTFADHSYVAMPRLTQRQRVAVAEKCVSRGIGVIGVVSDSAIEPIVSPMRSHSHTWRREYAYLGGLARGC